MKEQNTKGQNIQDVQKTNRSLVIHELLKTSPTTRAQISANTGLKKATVTNIVADLMDWGIVREVGMSTGKSGRRTILIELIADKYIIICGWLKRTEFIVEAFDIYGNSQWRKNFAIGADSSIDTVSVLMIEQLELAEALYRDRKILGIAVALPGPYIKREGKLLLTTGRSDWNQNSIESKLHEHFGPLIFIEHDANAATMDEWYVLDHPNKIGSLLCVMPGHGVGGGMIDNGKIVNGFLGTAGELGHMSIDYHGRRCECGNYGCLEKYCSIEALLSDVREALPDYPASLCHVDSTFEEVMNAYHQNDPLATKAVEQVARYLGYGLTNVVNLMNPELLIIGDELPKAAGEPFIQLVRDTMKERILPEIYNEMTIQLSTLDDSVLQGLCFCLLDEIEKEPEHFSI